MTKIHVGPPDVLANCFWRSGKSNFARGSGILTRVVQLDVIDDLVVKRAMAEIAESWLSCRLFVQRAMPKVAELWGVQSAPSEVAQLWAALLW